MKSLTPIYISKGTPRSIWNEYRIYEDRVELEFHLFFKTFVIPADELVEIKVYRPPVIRTVFWALKIDLADLFTHVGIERKNGCFKRIRFTPTSPDEFTTKVKEIFK